MDMDEQISITQRTSKYEHAPVSGTIDSLRSIKPKPPSLLQSGCNQAYKGGPNRTCPTRGR
jgi:hypothetical protein